MHSWYFSTHEIILEGNSQTVTSDCSCVHNQLFYYICFYRKDYKLVGELFIIPYTFYFDWNLKYLNLICILLFLLQGVMFSTVCKYST
jgi:hypothetical protein